MINFRPALALGTLLLVAPTFAQDKPSKKKHFFGLDRLWTIHLSLDAEAFEALYPTRSRRRLAGQRSRFPYVKAKVEIAGHDLGVVGLRFKGASTWSYSARTLKRSFKLDFDRHDPRQTFLGLKKLSLNNNVTDPTQIREAVTYATYRKADVPASRTAFAKVYLTVPGDYDATYLGLYTVVEQFDRQLLKRHFDSKQGLILKPRTVLGYYGDEWSDRYASSYGPKTEPSPGYTKPVVDLARLARADDKTFAEGLEAALDVDQFLRYLAVTVITANTDSPLNLAHNFYLVVPRDDRRVHWIPWDLNLSLNGWGRAGPDQDRLSLVQPSPLRFVQRVFDVGQNEDRYLAVCRELIDGCCSKQEMLKRIELATATTRDAIIAEADRDPRVLESGRRERSRSDISRFGGKLALADFVARRDRSVRAQLADASFGVPGGMSYSRRSTPTTTSTKTPNSMQRMRTLIHARRRPAIGKAFTRDDLHRAAVDVLDELDTDGKAGLTRAELEAALGSGGGETAAYLRRRAKRHARRMLRDLDADKDAVITKLEWAEATARSFDTWDRDDDGQLTRREMRGLGGTR